MAGVTGRMGTNQHLVRSILAIRQAGGTLLSDGTRVMPDPILIGRNPEKVSALAQQYGVTRWATDLDKALLNPDDEIFFDAGTTQMRPMLLEKAIAAGKHVYCEKPIATDLASALKAYKLAQKAGVKNGVVQDKIFLPGLLKLKMLRDSGFFGRMVAVRGEFGYWVFEGDCAAGAAAVLELSRRGRRRHHPRYGLPLALRARQHLRAGEERVVPRRDAYPGALGRETTRNTRRPRTTRPMRPSNWKAASSRISTCPG